jgi:hypothetical protein
MGGNEKPVTTDGSFADDPASARRRDFSFKVGNGVGRMVNVAGING